MTQQPCANPRDIEEIRKRWADKSWPHIGYFAHGDARSRQMARAALRKAGVTHLVDNNNVSA